MNPSLPQEPRLLSCGMIAVICAWFLSAHDDNALLFATLALIKQPLYPDRSQPILQMALSPPRSFWRPWLAKSPTASPRGG